MKKLITGLLSCFAMVVLMVPMALAQTPDGQTPVNEGVCNELQGDGITKGLYGLCVAFCEAQDHANVDTPITEDDLESLMNMKPAGRILAAYNKKKDKANNPNDPEMPCIRVEEPCPCWTADELASIDGVMFNNAPADTVYCFDREYTIPAGPTTIENSAVFEASSTAYSQAFTLYQDNLNGADGGTCIFINSKNNADGATFRTQLFLYNEGITKEQLDTCRIAVQDRIAAIQSSCNAGNQN